MSDIRSYMKYKEQRTKEEFIRQEEKAKSNTAYKKDYRTRIREHRRRYFSAALSAIVLIVLVCTVFYIRTKNKIYTDYEIRSSVAREMINGTTVVNLDGAILTYSKDGINCSDLKGTVLWNQTYEMQNPIIAIKGKAAAIADYNGRTIYVMDNQSFLGEINTNLPIRNIAVAANGVVAAVLDDAAVTWISLYGQTGEELGRFRTRMKNSGYPLAVAMSENGQLVLVSYLYVDSGTIKSRVAFYNFGQVGKNKSDNFVGGYDYADSVVPFAGFMNSSTAFAVADNRIMFYSGSEIPESLVENFFEGVLQGVYYNSNYVGLVFPNIDGESKYRIDVYNTNGNKVLSKAFDIDYKDIVFCSDYFIVYNEQECMVCNMNGVEKYNGAFKDTVYTLVPSQNVSHYVLVTQDSLQTIELR